MSIYFDKSISFSRFFIFFLLPYLINSLFVFLPEHILSFYGNSESLSFSGFQLAKRVLPSLVSTRSAV